MSGAAERAPEAAPAGAAEGRAAAARRLLGGHAGPVLALAALHLVAFSRSLFGTAGSTFPVPWDFDASYHRWLVYAGDCFRAGTLPLWNPFNAAGTPLYANPQSQLWSPATLVVGTLVGYTHAVAQRQLVLTLLLAAWGAYALGAALWRCRWAGLFAGLAYGLSSALFTNMQHMDIVNAAALLPWLAWAALRASDGARWAFPALALALAWQVTWGYPAVVAASVLWLVVLWLGLALARPGARARLSFLSMGAVTGALALGLAAVHWLPVVAHRGDFPRGAAPLEVEWALDQSLSFAHLWGWLLGMMSGAVPDGATLDVSMQGVYVGVVSLPLLAAALVRERSRRTAAVAAIGAVSLLLALGGSSPLRTLLNSYLPALNSARFPAADSRTVAALAMALLAGAGARLLADGREDARAVAAAVGRWLLPAVVVALVAARLVLYRGMEPARFLSVGVNGASAALLWLAVALVLLARCGPRLALPGLAALLALDLSTNVLLNYRMIGQRVPRAQYAERVREQYRHDVEARDAATEPRASTGGPPGFPAEFSIQAVTRKRFDVNDYGGFRLARYERVLEDGLGPWLVSGPRAVALPAGGSPSVAAIGAAAAPPGFRILSYRPAAVAYELELPAPALLVLNEIGFPGWAARVDGGAWGPMREVAGGLRAVELPAGRHRLETRFAPRDFTIGAGISLASLAVLAGWLGAIAWRSRAARLGDR